MSNLKKYVCQLDEGMQDDIWNDVLTTMREIFDDEDEVMLHAKEAMTCKLCDLEDTIDIEKYL